MKVCVVGSGAREHALADVLGRTAEVVVTPGNAGIPCSVPDRPEDVEADLFVVGPEVPLVDGLADRLRADGRLVFGPGADGARLEGSKAWMKDLVEEAGVPTARHGTFTSVDPALAFLDTMAPPFVVKTDGLAAGKGVVVTDSLAEARNAVGDYLSGAAFGDAGRRLVIEEGLVGPELSVLAVCDGKHRGGAPAGAGLQACRATATPAPTPGGWGPTRRSRSWTTPCSGRGHGPVRRADPGHAAVPGHRLPRRAVRGADVHRGRTQADRVQRALRRPGVPGGGAPGDLGPRRTAGRGRGGPTRPGSDDLRRRPRHRDLRLRGVPGVAPDRGRDRGTGRGPGGGRRLRLRGRGGPRRRTGGWSPRAAGS